MWAKKLQYKDSTIVFFQNSYRNEIINTIPRITIPKGKTMLPVKLCGGGHRKVESAQPSAWTYPVTATLSGPILLATFPNTDLNALPQWQPTNRLLTIRDDHPLDCLLPDELLTTTKAYCNLDPELATVYSQLYLTTVVTTSSFRDLLSPGKPINDDIIAIFLEITCSELNLSFLCPQFIPLLMREGWNHITRYFAAGNRRHMRSTFRPLQHGESAIAIPCFIDDSHWIAVTRREVNGKVLFLYADDVNNPSSELLIKSLLSNTSHEFYPPSATWINCTNYTYHPHSNECGPRKLQERTHSIWAVGHI
jgi:hypothetical protein